MKLPHGDKTDAVIQACNRFGLIGNLRVIQQFAADLLKKAAIARKKQTVEHYETQIEFLTYMIKSKKGNRQTHAKGLVSYSELYEKAVESLEWVETVNNPEWWVSYQVTMMVRKKYQHELNRVSDCRTYKGQPARDMRSSVAMKKAG